VTDPKSMSDPRDQEQAVERRPRHNDPTAVAHTRESDASTITNSGLAGGRPSGGPRITPERERTDGNHDDPVMPDDDAALKTNI